MITKNIIHILCQKYNLGYVFFNDDFKIIAYSNIPLHNTNSDIREHFIELIGLENEIKQLKNSNTPIELNMIQKEDGFYDVNIEYVQNKGFLLYMQRKDKDIEKYTKSVQNTNEQLLLESLSKEEPQTNKHTIVALVNKKKIESVNENFCNFFQITAKEIVGKKLSEFFKQKRPLFLKTDTYTAIDKEKRKHLFQAENFLLNNTEEEKQVFLFNSLTQ